MFQPIKVIEFDLERPLETVDNLKGYQAVLALVRVHGLPVGTVTVPVRDGRCEFDAFGKAILAQHRHKVVQRILQCALRSPVPSGGFRIQDMVAADSQEPPVPATLLVTVAVCTRDRTTSLRLTLDALARLNYQALDLLVVDNAPSNDGTERLVRECFPTMRYVREDRPGLDWARNRAIQEAYGDVIAFTDDDAVADPNWVSAIVRVFLENPEVMSVTGLVLPYELETEAQLIFEQYGSFARGFERHWYRVNRGNGKPDTFQIGAGRFGTGANMAFRKKVFNLVGGFDPALDVGTVTNGGGDLEIFFRVLQEGHPLVYEPAALVWHRHRREYAELKRQIHTWGIGLFSYFVRSALVYREARWAIVRFALWYLWWRYIRRLARWPLLQPGPHLDLLLAELKGVCLGLFRYQQARRRAVQIMKTSGSLLYAMLTTRSARTQACPPSQKITGVRFVDLSQPLKDLTDVTDCSSVRVFVSWQDRLLGDVMVANRQQVTSAEHLREAIASKIGLRLFDPQGLRSRSALEAEVLAALAEQYLRRESRTRTHISSRPSMDLSVSLVVATYDRPESLRRCLRSLLAQQSERHIEIIVVDNHPASARTPPVVAEFPGVRLVNEPRQGLSYARNAGIAASKGYVVVSTDDDVVAPHGWLERLIAPFADDDVMVVTGNVLPGELETRAQTLFETYGGLGRGYEPFEADANWFASFGRRAVPTWRLGGTANAAFRSTILSHRDVGLLDEALGAGTPTGCSEDTYLFYKVLKAGYRIVYEPHAYVWHMHRREMRSLRRQLYNYSKGHVAYHLTTLLRDRDPRALTRLLVELPLCHVRKALARLRGWSDYPLSLIGIEAIGNLVGPVALWRSRRRVKRLGRSEPYVQIPERVATPRKALDTDGQSHPMIKVSS